MAMAMALSMWSPILTPHIAHIEATLIATTRATSWIQHGERALTLHKQPSCTHSDTHPQQTMDHKECASKKNKCMSRLKEMGIQLGSDYSISLDIETNPITRNWPRSIKMYKKNFWACHLCPPHEASFEGTSAMWRTYTQYLQTIV